MLWSWPIADTMPICWHCTSNGLRGRPTSTDTWQHDSLASIEWVLARTGDVDGRNKL